MRSPSDRHPNSLYFNNLISLRRVCLCANILSTFDFYFLVQRPIQISCAVTLLSLSFCLYEIHTHQITCFDGVRLAFQSVCQHSGKLYWLRKRPCTHAPAISWRLFLRNLDFNVDIERTQRRHYNERNIIRFSILYICCYAHMHIDDCWFVCK